MPEVHGLIECPACGVWAPVATRERVSRPERVCPEPTCRARQRWRMGDANGYLEARSAGRQPNVARRRPSWKGSSALQAECRSRNAMAWLDAEPVDRARKTHLHLAAIKRLGLHPSMTDALAHATDGAHVGSIQRMNRLADHLGVDR